jgi:hypothetical protein
VDFVRINRRVTYGLAALITICTLGYVWVPGYRPALALAPHMGHEPSWSAVLTNGFICLGSSPLNLFILIALIGYFNQAQAKTLWRRFGWRLGGAVVIGLLGVQLLQAALFGGMGWGYLSAMLVAIWLGVTLEQRWGSQRLLFFTVFMILIPQGLGLFLLSMIKTQQSLMGAHPLFNGWMTALCLMHGANRLPGLNIKIAQLVWVLVLLDGLTLVLDGSLNGAMGLAGTGVAWLLVSGRWRPEHLILGLRSAINERRRRRQRDRFRVIPGKKS